MGSLHWRVRHRLGAFFFTSTQNSPTDYSIVLFFICIFAVNIVTVIGVKNGSLNHPFDTFIRQSVALEEEDKE